MSAIDITKPVTGNPTTQSVRDNFATAASEITALQAGTIPGLAASSGSSLVGFIQAWVNAVATTGQEKLRQFSSMPADAGAIGDGSTSDQTNLQNWVNAVSTSLGGTDPGHGLQFQEGKKYKLTDAITIGNRRIAFKGNAGGMGSGASSIFQSVVDKDVFDFTTGNSDVASFADFMILGFGSGTGRGIVLGRSAQPWFDSRVTNIWLASLGGKCIDAINSQGGHYLNNGMDSGTADGLYITKGSNNIVSVNRLYGMSSRGITLLEGENNNFSINHIDLCGATDDLTAGILIDVDTASSKSARGNIIAINTFRADANDIVLDGNGGTASGNKGCDTLLITGNISDRAARRFLLATDSHQLGVMGNYVSTCNQSSGGFSAFEFSGTCDSAYFSGNKVATTTGSVQHEYALKIGATVTNFVLGENDLPAGLSGKIQVVAGGHVRALPGAAEYERFMCKLFDDFRGPALNTFNWGNHVGSNGSIVAPALVSAVSGKVRMVTGADAGGTMALNGVQIWSGLNWQPNSGSLVWECKVLMSAITNVAVYVGLTDQVSALEMPFELGAGDALTSNASDGCGVLFDTAADTDNWWLVGVRGNTDATKQNTLVAPVANTYETFRIEFVNATTVKFYRNHTLIGAQMALATSSNVPLTPVIAALSRGAATRNIDADYIMIESERA